MTSSRTWGEFFDPHCGARRKMAALPLPVAILDDLICGNRKWGHPRWRPEAEGPPFCAARRNGGRKTRPILLKAPYYQSSIRRIHPRMMDSPHKWPVVRKAFPRHGVIAWTIISKWGWWLLLICNVAFYCTTQWHACIKLWLAAFIRHFHNVFLATHVVTVLCYINASIDTHLNTLRSDDQNGSHLTGSFCISGFFRENHMPRVMRNFDSLWRCHEAAIELRF